MSARPPLELTAGLLSGHQIWVRALAGRSGGGVLVIAAVFTLVVVGLLLRRRVWARVSAGAPE